MFETLLNIITILSFIITTYDIIANRLDKHRERKEERKKAYLESIEKALQNGEYPPRKDKHK